MMRATVGSLGLIYHAQEGRKLGCVLCGRHDVRCDAEPEVLGWVIKAMGCRGRGRAASQREGNSSTGGSRRTGAPASVGSLEVGWHVIAVKRCTVLQVVSIDDPRRDR